MICCAICSGPLIQRKNPGSNPPIFFGLPSECLHFSLRCEASQENATYPGRAQLSGLSVDEIERLFVGTWTSLVAVILKAVGFRLATVDAIYRSRLSSGETVHDDLIQTKAEFMALRRPTAERILRFFYAKRAVKISNLSGGSSLGHRLS